MLQELSQNNEQILDGELVQNIYKDEKLAIGTILNRDDQRIQDLTSYCEDIEELSTKLKVLLSKSIAVLT